MTEKRFVQRGKFSWNVSLQQDGPPTSHHDTREDAVSRALTSAMFSGGGIITILENEDTEKTITIDRDGNERISL